MQMVNVGIIGTGVMGAGHARFIKQHVPDAIVVGLSDVDPNKISKLSDELGTVLFSTANPEELMNDPRVNAVIIASPDPLHVEHLRLAIASGKQILCEKPIATTIEDAQMITNEIRSYESQVGKKMISFGFMRRFDPCYQEVRRLIATGDFGAPTFFRTVTRNVSSTGATSTGLFTNIAIHDFDIYRWLFNDEWDSIKSFYPKRSSLSPEGLNDPLIIIGRLKSGITMVGDIVAFNNYGFDCRVEVICEKGTIQIGTHGDVITQVNGFGGATKGGKMAENWMTRFEPSYIEELKAWVEEVKSGVINTDLATVEDALIANEVCALGIASK
jgi:myo-inositol 2-dehydrogenase / D-chiro-inositol 1-dehydrogenase